MTKLLMYLLLFAPVALFTTACNNNGGTAEKPKDFSGSFDTAALRITIDQKNKAFAKAFTSSDSAGMVNNYTEDGKIFAPNADRVVGQAAIGKLVSQFLKFGIKEFSDVITDIYGNEDNLIEEGTYFMGDGKGNTIDKGKYICIWRKVHGDWKAYSDIFNTSLPEKTGK